MSQKYCIITPDSDPESSTFIKILWDKLNGEKDFLYNGLIPSTSINKGYLRNPSIIDSFFVRLSKINRDEYFFEKYLKTNSIELVYAQYGPTGASVVDICKRNGIKLITHFHGYDAYEKTILEEYSSTYKKVFDYSEAIIAVSKDMINQLVKLGAKRGKIVYTPCAPNNEFFKIQPKYGSDNFLFTGRFVDKKAPHLLILAFAKVVEKYEHLRLHMVGDGPLLNACMNLVRVISLQGKVFFHGRKTHSEVLKMFADTFCYVQHSIIAENGDSEGTPVSILEANAASLPIVSTRHAGIKDTQIEEETAYLVDEFSIDEMAEKMILLAENRQIAEKMGKTGKQNVMQNYSLSIHLRIIEEVLEKSLNS